MKLLIIGHSVVDHIFRNEEEIILPGGIYYSALGFSSVGDNSDLFYLLTSIDEKDNYRFRKVFDKFDLSYANKFRGIPHVNLYESGHGERGEHYREFISPLNCDKINDWNQFDGIYINMITGRDLSSDTFVKIRKNFNGNIYLDVHTLSRGLDDHNHRFFRKIPEYEKYLANVDLLQVNERELLTVTPYDEEEKIIATAFKLGLKIFIVTKGENGVDVYSADGKNFHVDAEKVNVKNKIGCGDVFGSVFFYYFSRHGDIENALLKANTAAAFVTTYSNNNEMMKLRDDFFERYT